MLRLGHLFRTISRLRFHVGIRPTNSVLAADCAFHRRVASFSAAASAAVRLSLRERVLVISALLESFRINTRSYRKYLRNYKVDAYLRTRIRRIPGPPTAVYVCGCQLRCGSKRTTGQLSLRNRVPAEWLRAAASTGSTANGAASAGGVGGGRPRNADRAASPRSAAETEFLERAIFILSIYPLVL